MFSIKTIQVYLLALMVLFFASCDQKVVTPVTQQPPVTQEPPIVSSPDSAQKVMPTTLGITLSKDSSMLIDKITLNGNFSNASTYAWHVLVNGSNFLSPEATPSLTLPSPTDSSGAFETLIKVTASNEHGSVSAEKTILVYFASIRAQDGTMVRATSTTSLAAAKAKLEPHKALAPQSSGITFLRDTTDLFEKITLNANAEYGDSYLWTIISDFHAEPIITNEKTPTLEISYPKTYTGEGWIDLGKRMRVKVEIQGVGGKITVEKLIYIHMFSQQVEGVRYWATSTIPTYYPDGSLRKGGARHKIFALLNVLW